MPETTQTHTPGEVYALGVNGYGNFEHSIPAIEPWRSMTAVDRSRLIAATPDLLEAAQLAREVIEDLVRQLPGDERLADYRLDGAELADQKLRAAIAKAEGRE